MAGGTQCQGALLPPIMTKCEQKPPSKGIKGALLCTLYHHVYIYYSIIILFLFVMVMTNYLQ